MCPPKGYMGNVGGGVLGKGVHWLLVKIIMAHINQIGK